MKFCFAEGKGPESDQECSDPHAIEDEHIGMNLCDLHLRDEHLNCASKTGTDGKDYASPHYAPATNRAYGSPYYHESNGQYLDGLKPFFEHHCAENDGKCREEAPDKCSEGGIEQCQSCPTQEHTSACCYAECDNRENAVFGHRELPAQSGGEDDDECIDGCRYRPEHAE